MRERARANVRFAERERPRHHQVRWLGFRQQALAMDTLSAGGRGGAAARQTSQARAQPQDDVPGGRSSRANAAACAARRHAGRQARLASSTIMSVTARFSRITRRIAVKRRRSITACPTCECNSDGPGATSARHPTCAAPAPCPAFTRPSRP